MRMMQPNELSVVDVRPLPDSRSRLAEHGGDSLIQVSSSTGPSPGLDNTFFQRCDPAPSPIVLGDLGHPVVPPPRFPPVPPGCPLLLAFRCSSEPLPTESGSFAGGDTPMAGMAAQRRCNIDLYGWGRDALTFCRMSVDEFDSLTNRIGWGAAFEVLLLAIARKCGDEVEEWERAGVLGIPWQRKRWSSLASLQSSYNDAVRRSFLEQFQRRSQCSRGSSRIPVTITRRGDGMIGKEACLMSLKV